ncbi:DUF4215 domain-containing protein [Myxococcaceae bacterium JPH2]|nr:DUF4215 domain-containing protein [Myxococcaceae bacterium JPH2]
MVTSSTRPLLLRVLLTSLMLTLAACGDSSPGKDPDGGTDSSDAGDGGPKPTVAICGDNIKHDTEACDDGNTLSGDGCSAKCDTVESGFTCPEAGKPCYRIPTCGNGVVETGESCDDRNTTSGDGCTSSCKEEAGWNCPKSGGRCVAKQCGDSIIAGDEDCDDGNNKPGDGCSATCRVEDNFKCPTAGAACVTIRCGDGVAEGNEQCDDGNNDMGDGCSPLCRNEPKCPNGICQEVCGDGVMLPGTTIEECDDGNTRDNDGCSHTCKKEPGFTCTFADTTLPDAVNLTVVYRDFRGADLPADGVLPAGHLDFENENNTETGILGALYSPLDPTTHKPVYAKGDGTGSATTHGKTAFDQWYKDTKNVNIPYVSTMKLARNTAGGPTSAIYVFDEPNFFPLDDKGWVALGKEPKRTNNHNFSFTSEVRYWFEFKGTEVLDFRGDDDVWVYINGKLALDLGGVHGALTGSVDLTKAAPVSSLGLQKGRIYEVVVLQAERHTTASSYKLTLSNFTTRTTSCTSTCGNGTVEAGEECDNKNGNLGGYNQCSPGCVWGPRCGDKHIDSDYGEECDDGGPTRTCSAVCKSIIG